jgi:photoactive yellow protein
MPSDDLFADQLILDQGLESLSRDDFDALAFGTIKLDRNDCVLIYNRFEGELAQRDQASTIGEPFFETVAPCTNNAVFRGELQRMLLGGRKNARFDYEFRFPWGARYVRIQLWVPNEEERWIFVLPKRRE